MEEGPVLSYCTELHLRFPQSHSGISDGKQDFTGNTNCFLLLSSSNTWLIDCVVLKGLLCFECAAIINSSILFVHAQDFIANPVKKDGGETDWLTWRCGEIKRWWIKFYYSSFLCHLILFLEALLKLND